MDVATRFEERLAELEALQRGWMVDEQGQPYGLPVDAAALNALRALVLGERGVVPPYAYAGRDGSVAAEWEKRGVVLRAELRPDGEFILKRFPGGDVEFIDRWNDPTHLTDRIRKALHDLESHGRRASS